MFVDLRFSLLFCAIALASACTSNVVMRRPPAYDNGFFGPFKRCAPNAECQDDASYDSSALNKSHTSFYQLPNCPYGIHDLAVLNAVVLVRCAAPDPARSRGASSPVQDSDTGLPVATSGGGTR